MAMPQLTVRALRSTAVEVPMKHALGTSRAVIRAAPLLLIDLETEEGVTGRAYLFCYVRAAAAAIACLVAEVGSLVKGQRLEPEAQFAALSKRFTLIGVQGIVRMALSGFDVAAWDALAVAAGQPLVSFLGAEPRPIRAYNSNGLGLMEPAKLADEAQQLLEGGFSAIKLRLGHETLEADLAALHAVRARVGAKIEIMVDYNQALSVEEAMKRGRALDVEGVYWLEEPIRHDDYEGACRLAKTLSTPVQIGENFSLPAAMEEAIGWDACDYVMPDLERIGGVTGWRRAAAIADKHGIPMSSHLFPEASAHLLAATPTVHWLEYVDWASAILEEPLRIEKGSAIPSARPGTGIVWNRDAVERYRIS
jgi:mandelate racemase